MLVYGYQISERLIPQSPVLFTSETSRDAVLRWALEDHRRDEDWCDFVHATAEANCAKGDLLTAGSQPGTTKSLLSGLLAFSVVRTATTSRLGSLGPRCVGRRGSNSVHRFTNASQSPDVSGDV